MFGVLNFQKNVLKCLSFFLWCMLFKTEWDLSIWRFLLFFHSGNFLNHFLIISPIFLKKFSLPGSSIRKFKNFIVIPPGSFILKFLSKYCPLFFFSFLFFIFSFPPFTLHGEEFPSILLPDFQLDILLYNPNFQKCCSGLWLYFPRVDCSYFMGVTFHKSV